MSSLAEIGRVCWYACGGNVCIVGGTCSCYKRRGRKKKERNAWGGSREEYALL